MALLTSISIKWKFAFFGTLLVGLAGLSSAMAVRELRIVDHAADHLAAVWLPAIEDATLIEKCVQRASQHDLFAAIAEGSASDVEMAEAAKDRAEAAATLKDYEEHVESEEERSLLADLSASFAEYQASAALLESLLQRDDRAAALARCEREHRAATAAVIERAERLLTFNHEGVAADRSEADAATSVGIRFVTICGIALTAISAIALTLLARSVLGPIAAITGRLREISEGDGDLTQRLSAGGRDEVSIMATCFNTFVAKIDRTVTEVKEGAEQIEAGSNQVAISSQALAAGASQQAATLQEISSSLQELAAQTQQNAHGATDAVALADRSRSTAEVCQGRMGRMSEAMSQIKDSSDKISKVLRVIDEIAFQTNLLALNAAVEAARAGEAGKGFAVVAEEVRNLAQRSAGAARETAQMVEESTGRADRAFGICADVVSSLGEIVSATKDVNGQLARIASASDGQAAGLAQITTGITELDKVTQATAANSEELAASSEETASQTTALKAMVQQFKVSGH